MALMMEDLDRLEDQALRTIRLKTEQAQKGNDWVCDGHSISSCKLLELIALAKLGHSVWMSQGKT
jgi:hypothetical protein